MMWIWWRALKIFYFLWNNYDVHHDEWFDGLIWYFIILYLYYYRTKYETRWWYEYRIRYEIRWWCELSAYLCKGLCHKVDTWHIASRFVTNHHVDPMIDFDDYQMLSNYDTNHVFMSEYRIFQMLKIKKW